MSTKNVNIKFIEYNNAKYYTIDELLLAAYEAEMDEMVVHFLKQIKMQERQ